MAVGWSGCGGLPKGQTSPTYHDGLLGETLTSYRQTAHPIVVSPQPHPIRGLICLPASGAHPCASMRGGGKEAGGSRPLIDQQRNIERGKWKHCVDFPSRPDACNIAFSVLSAYVSDIVL